MMLKIRMSNLFKTLSCATLFMTLQLMGCSITPSGSNSDAESSSYRGDIAGAVVDDAEVASIVQSSNASYILSFNDKQQVVVRNTANESAPKVISDSADDGNTKRIYIAAAATQKQVNVAWMEKNTKPRGKSERTGQKYIVYSKVTDDGRTSSVPRRISSGGGAFVPILRATDTDDVFALWTDERNGGKFDIFLNVSHDGGATWKSEEVKLSDNAHLFVVDPAMEVIGNNLIVVWVQVDQANTFSVVSRTSTDRGETWSGLNTVYKGKNQPVSPQLVRSENALTACWATVAGVGCSSTEDAGAKWADATTIQGTERAGLILAKADSKGRIHLISNQRSENGASAGLFYSHSEGKNGFSAAVPISRQPMFQAKAISPALEIDATDGVFVAWVDYSYFKPLVNVTFSIDAGNTWEKPYVLSYFGRVDEQLYPVATRNATGGVTLTYLSVGKMQNQWLTQNIALTSPKSTYSPNIDVNQLKKRVNQYWTSRVQADWSKSYDFMDPFYRKNFNRDAYIKTQGKVRYYGFSQKGDPVASGLRASVDVAFDSEMPAFVLDGKTVEVPRKEISVNQEWVWIDGEWYVVFQDLFGNNYLPK